MLFALCFIVSVDHATWFGLLLTAVFDATPRGLPGWSYCRRLVLNLKILVVSLKAHVVALGLVEVR